MRARFLISGKKILSVTYTVPDTVYLSVFVRIDGYGYQGPDDKLHFTKILEERIKVYWYVSKNFVYCNNILRIVWLAL
jgi:hypothetical protein